MPQQIQRDDGNENGTDKFMMQGDRAKVAIFTDGACRGNPGPGGWGVLLRFGSHEKQLSGYASLTTNNRMELAAVVRGLMALKRPCQVVVFSDSQYVCRGMNEWIRQWKQNGWKNSAKKMVENSDLWQKLDHLANIHTVQWQWVRGHNGHAENEMVDELARKAIELGQQGSMVCDELGLNPLWNLPDEEKNIGNPPSTGEHVNVGE